MLNSEKIWKIQKKRKLNCEMIWKIQKKSKLNCEKIWKIPIFFLNDMENMEERKVE
jgi:hypothetical protein